jgi:DNA polymerase delta subunit 1
MGLVLKRRDNCDLVKDIYGGVLDILMKCESGTNSVQTAIEFLYRSLQDLIDGKVPMEKLCITKALRSYYKKPQQIAHSVLADRMTKRDPGNKPKSGDRIKYAYVNVPAKMGVKLLQGDKIETPEFIETNRLQIDYTHYITNQIMKPLQQLFGLALEQIWEQQCKERKINAFRQKIKDLEKECNGNLEIFMKKKEKLSSSEIKILLFDTFLTKIKNAQNRMKPLESFWKK